MLALRTSSAVCGASRSEHPDTALDARSGWVQIVIAISLWAIGAHARELRSILAGSAIATRCRRIQIVVRFAKNAADAAVGPERASDIHRPNIIRRVVVDAVSLYGILDVRNIPNVTSSRGANSVCDRSGKIARSTVETTRRWPPVVVVFSTSAVSRYIRSVLGSLYTKQS